MFFVVEIIKCIVRTDNNFLKTFICIFDLIHREAGDMAIKQVMGDTGRRGDCT